MDDFFFQFTFWVLAAITLLSALMVATLANLSRGIVFLVFFFLGGAGLYFLLDAEFLALIQVLVYAGAVAVLFAFVVMLTPRMPGAGERQALNQWSGLFIAGLFLIFMITLLAGFPGSGDLPAAAGAVDLNELGQVLLGNYLLPFELVSLVLLVALVGAVLYTGRKTERGEADRDPD